MKEKAPQSAKKWNEFNIYNLEGTNLHSSFFLYISFTPHPITPPMPSMEPSAVEPSETTPLLSQLASNRNPETQLSNASNNTKRVSPGRQIAPDLLRGLLMAFMAIDHTSVTVGGYAHGTGVAGEEASHVITEWNSNLAYLLRTLSHLCAPGFTMLLGMGIAFFTESVSDGFFLSAA
jgi:hypothetical protein